MSLRCSRLWLHSRHNSCDREREIEKYEILLEIYLKRYSLITSCTNNACVFFVFFQGVVFSIYVIQYVIFGGLIIFIFCLIIHICIHLLAGKTEVLGYFIPKKHWEVSLGNPVYYKICLYTTNSLWWIHLGSRKCDVHIPITKSYIINITSTLQDSGDLL